MEISILESKQVKDRINKNWQTCLKVIEENTKFNELSNFMDLFSSFKPSRVITAGSVAYFVTSTDDNRVIFATEPVGLKFESKDNQHHLLFVNNEKRNICSLSMKNENNVLFVQIKDNTIGRESNFQVRNDSLYRFSSKDFTTPRIRR